MLFEGGSAFGEMMFTDTLTVEDGIEASFIGSSAKVEVVGATTIASGVLQVFDDAELFGTGGVVVEIGSAIDMQLGLITKDVTIDDGGMLIGNGDIVGDIIMNGQIGPGNSAGTLRINGAVTMDGTSTTCVEVGGSSAGEFDLIEGFGTNLLAGTMSLDGELVVTLIDSYIPDSNDEFFFITGFDIVGTFDNTNSFGGGSISTNGGVFAIEYGADFVRLHDFTAIPEPGSLACLILCGAIAATRRRRNC